uniref:Silencing suppressor protein n=1 Tax=Tobacco rattle virus TaxID=12295 RepID=A0A0U3BM42_9VIRU|nr:silencing suppressor protein [Tobacco rattle virus]ALV82078.1 silencing suppressor protein [Tobacco rattle virus]
MTCVLKGCVNEVTVLGHETCCIGHANKLRKQVADMVGVTRRCAENNCGWFVCVVINDFTFDVYNCCGRSHLEKCRKRVEARNREVWKQIQRARKDTFATAKKSHNSKSQKGKREFGTPKRFLRDDVPFGIDQLFAF